MISEKVQKLLNEQITKEFYSAYLYLDFSNYYANIGLKGFASWYQVQTQEERDHAMLFIQYMRRNGLKITLEAIAKPDKTFSDAKGPLTAAYEHECYVTSLIHTIYEAASQDKDYRTMQFLDWFVKEQAEEEETASGLVQKWDLYGADPKSLFLLDQEMGKRTYSAPSLKL